MLIYLAELSHTGVGRSPNTVPLAAGYLAAAALDVCPNAQIQIFRDPQLLLDAMRNRTPHIVGLSLHLWSEQLSAFCAQQIRKLAPNTLIIVGGPSVPSDTAELYKMLEQHPEYDIAIPNEGEPGFKALVEMMSHVKEKDWSSPLAGCARLYKDTLLWEPTHTSSLADIPSPYLTGLLDEFLAGGYEPVVQSSRGCPYRCTFCVSGKKEWSNVRSFSLERVFAELDYIAARTKTDILILTDENLGILKERDAELAKQVAELAKQGWPKRLYFYSAKIVTPEVLEVVETLAPLGEFGMSFQTLDPAVTKTIQRTNLKPDQFQQYLDWAKERRLITSTEMIFGFPGETVESYRTGMEWLLKSGVDRIYSYNLKLLSGTALATEASREQHQYRTMWRVPDRNYGNYDDTIISEAEEVVIGSETFSYKDYMTVRRYGFWLELASGRGYFTELIQMLINMGVHGEKLIGWLAEHTFDDYPCLEQIMAEYDRRAACELFSTPSLVSRHVAAYLSSNEPVPETKLNYVFTGYIMLYPLVRRELFNCIKTFVEQQSPDCLRIIADYLDVVLFHQIVGFLPNEPALIVIHSPILIGLLLPPDAERFIKERIPINTVKRLDDQTIQDIYMTIGRFGLLRQQLSLITPSS